MTGRGHLLTDILTNTMFVAVLAVLTLAVSAQGQRPVAQRTFQQGGGGQFIFPNQPGFQAGPGQALGVPSIDYGPYVILAVGRGNFARPPGHGLATNQIQPDIRPAGGRRRRPRRQPAAGLGIPTAGAGFSQPGTGVGPRPGAPPTQAGIPQAGAGIPTVPGRRARVPRGGQGIPRGIPTAAAAPTRQSGPGTFQANPSLGQPDMGIPQVRPGFPQLSMGIPQAGPGMGQAGMRRPVQQTRLGIPLVQQTRFGIPQVQQTRFGIPQVQQTRFGIPQVQQTRFGVQPGLQDAAVPAGVFPGQADSAATRGRPQGVRRPGQVRPVPGPKEPDMAYSHQTYTKTVYPAQRPIYDTPRYNYRLQAPTYQREGYQHRRYYRAGSDGSSDGYRRFFGHS